MTITIELVPELEKQIKEAAAKAGLSVDAYILESVTQRLPVKRQQKSNISHLSKQESDRLQKINQSLAQIEWLRYREIIKKRQEETLTRAEQQALIALSDQIEEANAKRIGYVAELAVVRKTTLSVLMSELGLKPVTYA